VWSVPHAVLFEYFYYLIRISGTCDEGMGWVTVRVVECDKTVALESMIHGKQYCLLATICFYE
jgi:hypothetical protein